MTVLLLSPAGTGGWRANEEALAASLERCGFRAEVVRVPLEPGRRLLRFWPLGSLIVAWRARRALGRALRGAAPDALVAVNPTAAMLLPFSRLKKLGVPVAIRIDCPAGEQYPGPLHAPHRRLERRALRRADLALAMGPRSRESVAPLASQVAEVPIPIEAPAREEKKPLVLAYGGQPDAKGIDRIARAWATADGGEAVLVVTGVDPEAGREFLGREGIEQPPSLEWAGLLPRAEHSRLLSSASVFVSASRLEGHGIAQLEALAAGALLVTTPAAGAYEAEPLARELDPALVVEPDPDQLARAIETALATSDEQRATYTARAAELLRPFSGERADGTLAGALNSLGISARAPTAGRSREQTAD